MKRDMELVRRIVLTLEDHEHGYAPSDLFLPGYSQEQIGYHVLLMAEGDLLIGTELSAQGDPSPRALATRLTWKGHEFADAARNDTIWSQAKALMTKAGG